VKVAVGSGVAVAPVLGVAVASAVVVSACEAITALRVNVAVSPGGISTPVSKRNTFSVAGDATVAVWLAAEDLPFKLNEETTSGSVACISTRVIRSVSSLVLRTSNFPPPTVSPPVPNSSATLVAAALPPTNGVGAIVGTGIGVSVGVVLPPSPVVSVGDGDAVGVGVADAVAVVVPEAIGVVVGDSAGVGVSVGVSVGVAVCECARGAPARMPIMAITTV
jgi:hypothetical protein